jgi:hypothetical protein
MKGFPREGGVRAVTAWGARAAHAPVRALVRDPGRVLARALVFAVALALAVFAAVRHAGASEARRFVELAYQALSQTRPDTTAARTAATNATAVADDAEAVAEAYFFLGQLDEDAGAFGAALDRDRAAIAALPESAWARRAQARIEWLEARSEGDFAPLVALERVRRDPDAADDPVVIAALAERASQFPPGRVRVEARMLVAEAWLGRLHRPDLALAPLRLVESDPNTDPLTARLAEREIVDAEITRGALNEASAEAHAHAVRLDPRFVARVDKLVRRQALFYVALCEIALFLALTLGALARAVRRASDGIRLQRLRGSLRGLGPIAAGFGAYIALVGGALASRYESGNAAPFLALGAVTVPLVLCAHVWNAVGRGNALARAARAVLSGVSVVAAAFVLLDVVNPTYLDGFGL